MFKKINNKGMLYEVGLVLFAIIILSASFYNIITSQGLNAKIGKSSAKLVELDKEAKLKLDLIEQASLFSIYNSLNQLAENSGYSRNKLKDCIIWNINKDCQINQEILKENFKSYLYEDFNKIITSQNLNYYSIDITSDNENLIFTFNSPNQKIEKDNFEYYINHKFQKKIKYDFKDYERLYTKFSQEVIQEKCPDQDQKSTHINENLIEPGLICKENLQFLSFEYTKDKFYFGDPSNSFEYPLKPVIKFKLNKVQKLEPTTIQQ